MIIYLINKRKNKDLISNGNCYYKSLSFFFINNQTYHFYFRNFIYNYIANHEGKITKDYPFINVEDNLIPIKEYIKKINTENFYVGEIELLMTSKIFNINIIVLEYIKEYKGYIQHTKIEINDKKLSPILVLEYIENNKLGHYNIIHLKLNEDILKYINDDPLILNQKYNYRFRKKINQYQFSYKISHDKKLSNFKSINNNKSSFIPHDNSKDKIFSIKTADNFNNNLNSENQDISLNSIYEEDYILQIKDLKSSSYPIYPNSVFEYRYYFDIHVYLLSKLTNRNEHIYPYYILNKTDNEIDNSKKIFRNLCLNYELYRFNELCFEK